ncbi:hypothetical protein KM043_010811 [Ampulex compressa]|nr:hypothetical protein KM043_010811 [Ampulex compressa]
MGKKLCFPPNPSKNYSIIFSKTLTTSPQAKLFVRISNTSVFAKKKYNNGSLGPYISKKLFPSGFVASSPPSQTSSGEQSRYTLNFRREKATWQTSAD